MLPKIIQTVWDNGLGVTVVMLVLGYGGGLAVVLLIAAMSEVADMLFRGVTLG